MLTMVMLLLWGMLVAAPDTSIGRALHHGMVAAPARALSRIGRGHVVVGVFVAVILLAGWMLEADEIRMVLMAAPDIAGLASLIEMGTLTELVAALAAGSMVVRVRGVGRWLRMWLGRRQFGRRRRRSVSRRQDDEPGPAGLLAFA